METVDLNNLRETYLVANDWITRNIVKKKSSIKQNLKSYGCLTPTTQKSWLDRRNLHQMSRDDSTR